MEYGVTSFNFEEYFIEDARRVGKQKREKSRIQRSRFPFGVNVLYAFPITNLYNVQSVRFDELFLSDFCKSLRTLIA